MTTKRDESMKRTDVMPDAFDRALAMLDGRPDTMKAKATVITSMPVLGIGGSLTYVIQTWRTAEDGGRSRDTIFLQCYGADGAVRLVLNSDVADAIARQRDALTTRRRVQAGRKSAAERQARGETPAFRRRK
jgi:hypothetical protein